ncbi:MAG: hypothetical protein IJ794_12800 [Lachnospiraceae bacterium]|nr:hypothetical protein [Lachnospiraceae bacterium]MBR1854000.1 hypothetical protein [Lachnospiraceae bacterium]
MNAGKKKIIQYGIVLIAGPLAGLLALILVFMLPTKPMQEHLYWSLDMIRSEFTDELLVDGFPATLTGNFTDCLMLQQAVYAGGEHSVWERALRVYRTESYYDESDPDGWQPGRSLVDYMTGVAQPREVEYGRYWHGYLIFLKPLLLVTGFNSLRLFFSGLQLFLVGICVILMTRKGMPGLAGAFLVSMPFLYYVSTYASLSQSVCLYIMLAAVILQLLWDDNLYAVEAYGLFFGVVGMATSYFDLLTYPLVTLGFPLCVWLYIHGDRPGRNLKKTVLYSAEWAVGYLWMWGAKWVLADVITGSGVVQDALNAVSDRAGNAEGYGRVRGFWHVLSLNLDPFLNWGFILLVLVVALFVLGMLWGKRKGVLTQKARGQRALSDRMKDVVPYVFLALYPLGWWFLAQNHSEEHSIFTCRILAVSVFACAAALGKLADDSGVEQIAG